MIASDVPDSYGTPYTMARSLATYLSDAREIRRRVLDVFGTSPCTEEIHRLRRMHLRVEYTEPFRKHEVYDLQAERRALDPINVEFVKRLEAERMAA
jgi:hypothetical protein